MAGAYKHAWYINHSRFKNREFQLIGGNTDWKQKLFFRPSAFSTNELRDQITRIRLHCTRRKSGKKDISRLNDIEHITYTIGERFIKRISLFTSLYLLCNCCWKPQVVYIYKPHSLKHTIPWFHLFFFKVRAKLKVFAKHTDIHRPKLWLREKNARPM